MPEDALPRGGISGGADADSGGEGDGGVSAILATLRRIEDRLDLIERHLRMAKARARKGTKATGRRAADARAPSRSRRSSAYA